MGKGTLVLAGVGCASVAVLLTLWSLESEPSPTHVVVTTSTAAAESTAVAIAPYQAAPIAARAAPSPEPRATDKAQEHEEVAPPKSHEERVDAELTEVANIAANLRDLSDDHADLAWEERILDSVQQAISDERLQHFSLERVACGSAVCAIDLVVGEDEHDLDEGIALLTGREPFHVGGFADLSGGNSIALFIPREGQELPRLD